MNTSQKTNPPVEVPNSVWMDPTLTLENFSERVEQATGRKRRFRRSRDQVARGLSREEAFEEKRKEIHGS